MATERPAKRQALATGPELELGSDASASAFGNLWTRLVFIRRELHAHAEPGFEEVWTQERVRSELIRAGLAESDISVCARTGLVADIRGSGPAPAAGEGGPRCIALRSDMDALRMTEGNTKLPYRSLNKGIAHMCGHDGHMAILLGAAHLIQATAERIPEGHTVRLLFQPAEEGQGLNKRGGIGGAPEMIDDGCLEGVDEIYGLHNWPTMPLGSCKLRSGPVMAHVGTFNIVVRGNGGHGSQPHAAVDPVLAAAHLIVALQSVVSRNVHSKERAVVSVTMVHGGEADNVIPDTCTITGTIRDLDDKVFALIVKRITAIATSTAEAYGAKAEIDIKSGYPVVVNHETETAHVVRVAGKELGSAMVGDSEELPVLGGEDFAYFTQLKPGCFFFLGTKEDTITGLAMVEKDDKAKPRSNCMCHNTAFDFNDNAIPVGVRVWVRLVEDRFGVSLYPEKTSALSAADVAADVPPAFFCSAVEK